MTNETKTKTKPGAKEAAGSKRMKLRDLNTGHAANVRGGELMKKPGDLGGGITQNTK
jgi:hypothetical protein